MTSEKLENVSIQRRFHPAVKCAASDTSNARPSNPTGTIGTEIKGRLPPALSARLEQRPAGFDVLAHCKHGGRCVAVQ
jgi:hypothetical protein